MLDQLMKCRSLLEVIFYRISKGSLTVGIFWLQLFLLAFVENVTWKQRLAWLGEKRDSGLVHASSRCTMVTQHKQDLEKQTHMQMIVLSKRKTLYDPGAALTLAKIQWLTFFLLFFLYLFFNFCCCCCHGPWLPSMTFDRPGQAQTRKRAGNTNSSKKQSTKYIILKSSETHRQPFDITYISRCLSIL